MLAYLPLSLGSPLGSVELHLGGLVALGIRDPLLLENGMCDMLARCVSLGSGALREN